MKIGDRDLLMRMMMMGGLGDPSQAVVTEEERLL